MIGPVSIFAGVVFVGFGSALSCFAQSAPAITKDLTDQVAQTCRSASLLIEATGNPPLSYQWFHDENAIPSVDSNRLLLPYITVADGGEYYVVITNAYGSIQSRTMHLTIIIDAPPPVVTHVRAGATPEEIVVGFFSEACPNGGLDATTATDIFNYSLDQGVEVLAAQIICGFNEQVLLTTTSQTPGIAYKLTIDGVADRAGNVMPPAQITFTAASLLRGALRSEFYGNISDSAMSTLTNHARFPFCPSQTSFLSSFETQRNIADLYGTRVSGFLQPPTDGAYRFFLASDGLSELYLSTDQTTANKTLIAYRAMPSKVRDWSYCRPCAVVPSYVSLPITLNSNAKYYIEALMKEDYGPDHLAVAWQLPDGPEPVSGKDLIPGTYLHAYVSGSAHVQIIEQPHNAYGAWDCKAAFSVPVAVDPPDAPVTYQWQRNGVDIPGANSPTYATSYLTGADNAAKFRCRVSVPGMNLLSSEAFLTIGGDLVPLELRGAFAYSSNEIAVVFSSPTSPNDPYNYEFEPALAIDSISVLSVDPAVVLLKTALLRQGTRYSLVVSDVMTLSGNIIWPNPSRTSFYVHAPLQRDDALRAFLAGSKLIVDWNDPSAVLQSSISPAGPWTDQPDAFSPAIFNYRLNYCDAESNCPSRYFRLRTGE